MKAVSKTAFFCCGCRMLDAASPRPIVGDYFAQRLMGQDGLEYWKNFEAHPKPIASNQARHYIVENHLRRHLSLDQQATIIHIGAGLDTRPFRMHGGHWVEIDNPEILSYKEAKLPAASCRNELHRIPIHFDSDKLADKLAPYTGRNNVIFVVEGVLQYLTQAQRQEQLQALTQLFPKHHYICDLMTKLFFDKIANPFNKILAGLGTSFVEMQDEPAAMFHQAGYRLTNNASNIETARKLGLFGSQQFMMGLMPQKYRDGYGVYEFAFGG